MPSLSPLSSLDKNQFWTVLIRITVSYFESFDRHFVNLNLAFAVGYKPVSKALQSVFVYKCGIIVGTVGKIVSISTTSRAMFYRVIFRLA